MNLNKDKLMKLQTTREIANDQIWEITEGLQEKIKDIYDDQVEIQEINIWPEDGIHFIGYWLCDRTPWDHLFTWEEKKEENVPQPKGFCKDCDYFIEEDYHCDEHNIRLTDAETNYCWKFWKGENE